MTLNSVRFFGEKTMSLIAKARKLLWLYRLQDDFDQFLKSRVAFNEFLFDRKYFTDTSSADKGNVQDSELPLLQELVEKANALPGPIIEIGTLFGFTTQRIARWKDPAKKLITVDNYCWNPFGFSQDDHFRFTSKILWYCTQCGHIEQQSAPEYVGNMQLAAADLWIPRQGKEQACEGNRSGEAEHRQRQVLFGGLALCQRDDLPGSFDGFHIASHFVRVYRHGQRTCPQVVLVSVVSFYDPFPQRMHPVTWLSASAWGFLSASNTIRQNPAGFNVHKLEFI
jgi:hypothetical protein